MEPADFVSFAGRVVSFGKAGARSAVSRAYYGAYHAAQEFLRDFANESGGTSGTHVLVAEFFKNTDHANAMAIGAHLTDLHGDRIRADYRLADSRCESQIHAMRAVEYAVEIQRHLAAFKSACESDPALVEAFKETIRKVKERRRGG